jgi:SAM-dependent methyltransferase
MWEFEAIDPPGDTTRERLDLPTPPVPLRALIGSTDTDFFENRRGTPIYGDVVPSGGYQSVLDFGCGCGRQARRLALQSQPPLRYVGVEAHRGLQEWAQDNLANRLEGFRFFHHDVRTMWNEGPETQDVSPFPMEDGAATLVIAHSVFTHLFQEQTSYYLQECARVLASGGVVMSTWFLFDKAAYPMMQADQNCLFINRDDASNAVIYDRTWLTTELARVDLKLTALFPPRVRGFQWLLRLANVADATESVELSSLETAPFGQVRSPNVADAAKVRG